MKIIINARFTLWCGLLGIHIETEKHGMTNVIQIVNSGIISTFQSAPMRFDDVIGIKIKHILNIYQILLIRF